jgi:hypothetical protein
VAGVTMTAQSAAPHRSVFIVVVSLPDHDLAGRH